MDEEQPLPASPNPKLNMSAAGEQPAVSDECFVKPCSSKATSVIRLATQKLIKSPTSTTASASTDNDVRSPAKTPYNRQVKKLVIKLKKPFVPVIEEEANLHPPETSENCVEIVKKEQTINETNRNNVNNLLDDIDHQNGDDVVILECSEDVPFSPLRQSYTPLPTNDLLQGQVAQTDKQADQEPHNRNASIKTKSEEAIQIVDVRSILDRPSTSTSDEDDERATVSAFETKCAEKRLKHEANCSKYKNELVIFQINSTNEIEGKPQLLLLNSFDLIRFANSFTFFVFEKQNMRRSKRLQRLAIN